MSHVLGKRSGSLSSSKTSGKDGCKSKDDVFALYMKEKASEASLRRSLTQASRERDLAFAEMKKSQASHVLAVSKHEKLQAELRQRIMAVELIHSAWKKMEDEVKEMTVDDGLLKGSAVGTCAVATEVGCSRSIETNGKRSDMMLGEDDEAFDALMVQSVRETELSLAKEKSLKISSSLNSLHPTQTGGVGDLPLTTTTAVACTEATTTTAAAAAAAASTATATAAAAAAATAASVVVSPGRKQIGLNHDDADHDNGGDNDQGNHGAVVAITGDERTPLPFTMAIIAESPDLISPAILPPAIVSPGRKKAVAGAKSGNAAAASLGEESIVQVSKSFRVTAQGTGQATGLNQSSSTKRARRIGK
jgi:hypothetical protein